ncbi:MAG: ABC transporter permease [Phycisphaerae bacterium]|nr:ABC transporter permease [Gemmatimonadaceae bacterium]
MIQQLRQSLRSLCRAPTFTIVAVVTLALGIGATTSVLSIVYGVLLRALPYRNVGEIAMVLEQADATNFRLPSYLAFKDLQAAVAANADGPVQGIAFIRGNGALLRSETRAERIVGAWTSPGFFPLMGTPPLRGRVFAPDDEKAGANPVAVISHKFWSKRFAMDSSVIGRVVRINSSLTTIIGVMPREFAYPGFADFWMAIAQIEPTDVALQQRGMHVDSRTILRMKSAGDSLRAAAALNVVTARLAASYPEDAAHFTRVTLRPINNELFGDIQQTLLMLAIAASLVLLLGCVNVTTLSLIRGSVRARELAVRVALGASRLRIVRDLLTEGALLAMVGSLGGILLALGIVRGVREWAAVDLPRAGELTIDGGMLLIALLASVFSMVFTSLVPAWRVSRLAVADRLHGGQRGAAGNRGDTRMRSGLVALQFSFAVMLLVGAGLLMQSFRRMHAVPLGYDAHTLDTVAISPPSPNYDRPEDALALFNRVRDAAAAVPGVQQAALVNHAPGGGIPTRIVVPGRTVDASQESVLYRTASVEYLQTLGARMAQGRWFTPDDMRSPDASGFVINETLARRFWPDGNAVGQSIVLHRASSARPRVGEPMSGTVLGVVADMHSYGKGEPVPAEAWVPYTREVWGWITVLVRTNRPVELAPAIRKAILAVEPNIPLDAGPAGGVTTPARGSSLDRRELSLAMVSAFALCALVLAAIGLYGAVAYTVTQRTREVGIRMALGATPRGIARLVLGGSMKPVAVGIVGGLVGAFAGTRVIASLLFDTATSDVATYTIVPVVLLITAAFAGWLPTRRAVRVDPNIAMRVE